nr:concanavalin A-like lectin/glucanase domain-containing protein [Tanacetum cinerariifolium]GEZ74310.1 concanavalin A-like lectin/glucanase domain-containing protein [Tanacetum cinerariifolium]
ENTKVTMKAGIFSIKGIVTEMFHAFKGFFSSTPLEKHVVVWLKPPSYTDGEQLSIVTTTKEPKVENIKNESEHEPQDTKPIPITIVKPTAKPTLEVKLVRSSSLRPQPTGPIIDITPPEQSYPEGQTERPQTNPKLDRGYVYMDNEKGNFKVHKPFRFGDFGVTEWDELSDIVPKKKNKVVEDLMNSLINNLPKEVQFINNKVIEYPEHVIFFIDVFGDKAFQRIIDIHNVDVDSLLSYMVVAGNIRTPENQRFCVRLKNMIDEHLDKEKITSKKVKLEALGYYMD